MFPLGSAGQPSSTLAMEQYFSHRTIHLVLLTLIYLSPANGQAYQPIFTLDAFSVQQSCVQQCFTGGFEACYTDLLGSAIGCPNKPCTRTFAAVDECYCRGDLQLVANQWLSMCIDSMCTVGDNTLNLNNAASIYSGYCTERGFTALPAQTTAETTAQTSAANTRSTSSISNTRTSALSTSSSSAEGSEAPSSSAPSTDKTMQIALGVVGGVAVFAIAIAIIFFCKIRGKKRHQNPVHLGSYPGHFGDSSTHQLRHSGDTRRPDSPSSVGPGDSYSVANMPTGQRPFRPPHPAPPSLVSTARPMWS